MCAEYTESYYNLYHGTTHTNAENILKEQQFRKSKSGWCGSGVYFYDIKSKAWWSAKRTCRDIKITSGNREERDVLRADILNLNKKYILDLRTFEDIKKLAAFVDSFLRDFNFDIQEDLNEFDRITKKREMLLAFFCEENDIKFVVGCFKQRPQDNNKSEYETASNWNLVIGAETIYCARDESIISNIRRV